MKTGGKVLGMILGMGLLCASSGCIGPHYTKHPLVLMGKPPPELKGPRDPAILTNLTTEPWHKSLMGAEVGVGVVWFKSIGFNGWKDFGMHAKARGPVVLHQISSSGFFTVDIRLDSLTVDDVPISITNSKYMRLEIYLGRVDVDQAMRHETNEVITAEGRLAWDTDGWFEIHPQKTGDVRIEHPASRRD
jgi:hypothetical protein